MASPNPPIPENVEDVVEAPINPDLVSGVMPSEPICPKIPGVSIPSLPEPPDPSAALGDLFDSVPSPSDLMKKLANKGSSAADKLAKALEKAALDVADQVEKNLAAEFDKLSEGFTDLEAALEAVRSGVIDISSLGIDILSLPGDALAAAFPGFKKASECLEGEPGSAEAEFNAKAEKLAEGLAEGNGRSATAADEAITSQTEDTTDENGNNVKKKKIISTDEALAAVKGTTKTAVPQSDTPLATYQYVSRIL
jgi:hypothetical protein